MYNVRRLLTAASFLKKYSLCIIGKNFLDYINGEIAGMSFERQPAELYAPIRYVLSMGESESGRY